MKNKILILFLTCLSVGNCFGISYICSNASSTETLRITIVDNDTFETVMDFSLPPKSHRDFEIKYPCATVTIYGTRFSASGTVVGGYEPIHNAYNDSSQVILNNDSYVTTPPYVLPPSYSSFNVPIIGTVSVPPWVQTDSGMVFFFGLCTAGGVRIFRGGRKWFSDVADDRHL